jgi:hypothetical protein
MPDNTDEGPVSGGAGIGYYQPVARFFGGAYASQSNFYHFIFFLIIMHHNRLAVNTR